ncbi:hypothetical protein B9S53_22340 [Arthrospira sp. O9.13F]|nr:hypothetical protein B9S53_22340 [Arthrospira sp. O9.13F]
MDEQRIQQYVQLIKQLLGCANGKELAILEANAHLFDAGLLQVMAAYSQYLRSGGQDNRAEWLENFSQQLQPYILETESLNNSHSWEAVSQQVVQL